MLDELRRAEQELERAQRAARELWAALVVEWNEYDDTDSLVSAVMRRWKPEFGTDAAGDALNAAVARED